MTGLASRRMIRWLVGAFSTLLAFAGASSGQARAGCSHEVATTAHFEHLVQAGALPEPEVPSPESRDRPCSGPMCSKLPAVPLVPASLAFAFEPWACLAGALGDAPPPSSLLPSDPGRVVPIGGSVSIFHPPRSSSR